MATVWGPRLRAWSSRWAAIAILRPLDLPSPEVGRKRAAHTLLSKPGRGPHSLSHQFAKDIRHEVGGYCLTLSASAVLLAGNAD